MYAQTALCDGNAKGVVSNGVKTLYASLILILQPAHNAQGVVSITPQSTNLTNGFVGIAEGIGAINDLLP